MIQSTLIFSRERPAFTLAITMLTKKNHLTGVHSVFHTVSEAKLANCIAKS